MRRRGSSAAGRSSQDRRVGNPDEDGVVRHVACDRPGKACDLAADARVPEVSHGRRHAGLPLRAEHGGQRSDYGTEAAAPVALGTHGLLLKARRGIRGQSSRYQTYAGSDEARGWKSLSSLRRYEKHGRLQLVLEKLPRRLLSETARDEHLLRGLLVPIVQTGLQVAEVSRVLVVAPGSRLPSESQPGLKQSRLKQKLR